MKKIVPEYKSNNSVYEVLDGASRDMWELTVSHSPRKYNQFS